MENNYFDETGTTRYQRHYELIDKLSGIEETVSAMNAQLAPMVRGYDELQQKLSGILEWQTDMQEDARKVDGRLKYLMINQKKLDANQEKLFTTDRKILGYLYRLIRLQQTETELSDVRQELAERFEKNVLTRRAMIGVIRIPGSYLIKIPTITRLAGDLIAESPDYWLTPCLVAVSAWMDNEEELARRAAAEAMRRSEEKTALAMALIFLRYDRYRPGYAWLRIYFSGLDPANMTEADIACVNAYVNDIFGSDIQQECSDFPEKWLSELQGTSGNYREEQTQIWEEYCSRFREDIREKYPALAETAPDDFLQICESAGCLAACGDIRGSFADIQGAAINTNAMKKQVDSLLLQLINQYDESKMPDQESEKELRQREKLLKLLNRYGGDIEKAQSEMDRLKSGEEKKNILTYLTEALLKTDENRADPSLRKTAVRFLRGFINSGYQSYLTKAQKSFPETICLKIGGWQSEVCNTMNFHQVNADGPHELTNTLEYWQLVRSYRDYLESAKYKKYRTQERILYAAAGSGFLGVCVVWLLLGLDMIWGGLAAVLLLGGFLTALPHIRGYLREKICQEFEERRAQEIKKLRKALQEWDELCRNAQQAEQCIE